MLLITSNQIRYAELQETIANNQRVAAETNRHNLAYEAETSRHNVSTEAESSRHNIATEQESKRSNLANEQIAINSLNENIRHNKTVETETSRHNLQTESLTRQSNLETQRHNKAAEYLETNKLAEQQRHNMNAEYQQNLALNETTRHNLAAESLSHETNLINLERNDIYKEQNAITRENNLNNILLRQRELNIAQQNADSTRISANANALNVVNQASRYAVQNEADLRNVSVNERRADVSERQVSIDALRQSTNQYLANLKADYQKLVDIPQANAKLKQIDQQIRESESKVKSNNVNTLRTAFQLAKDVTKTVAGLLSLRR